MRDKLITLTVIVLFGLLVAWAAPQVNAWAAEEDAVRTFECQPGAKVIDIGEGRIRVIGVCEVIGVEDWPKRPDEPVYNYPYPVPDQPYPFIENPCDKAWYFGETCLP